MNEIRFSVYAWLLASLLFGAATGRADELEQLTRTLEQSADTLSAKPAEQNGKILRLISELEKSLMRGDAAIAQAAAFQLASESSVPPEVKATANRLSRELPRLLAERAEAFVTGVKEAVEHTREQCRIAQKEADLDPLLRELSGLRERQPSASTSALVARADRKLNSAIKTTEAWMDYFLAKSGGNRGRAIDALRHAENDADTYPILPTSEYEKRIAEVSGAGTPASSPDVSQILAKIKTLQDVEAIAPEIDVLGGPPTSPAYNYGLDEAKRWFTAFRAATAACLAGDIGDAWRRINLDVVNESATWFPQVLRLRTQLLSEIVPRYLKLPPKAERRPDETANDFFRRVLADAARQGRWEVVYRMSVGRGSGPVSGATTSSLAELAAAVNAFLQAKRLEEAGDFPSAIVSYERVLHSTAEFAPVTEATERLQSIRKTQPQAFVEVHPRVEWDRATQLIERAEEMIKQFTVQAAAFETARAAARPRTNTPAPAPSAPPPISTDEFHRLEERLKKAEMDLLKSNELTARLEKLEILFGPGADVLSHQSADEKKFHIWLGSDFTVYRSALPPQLERRLGWIVRYNGKQVLSRNARDEMAYRYHNLRPGNYTIFLTLDSPDTPASNVLDFTVSDEASAKLLKRRDRDLDRDGAFNADSDND